MAGRKIMKVKRHLPGDKIVSEEGKGVFRLSGFLSTPQNTKIEETTKPAAFMFQVTSQATFAGAKIDTATKGVTNASPEGALFKAPVTSTFAG
jgi:hypothetical protein